MTVQGFNPVTSKPVEVRTTLNEKVVDVISKINANQIEEIADRIAERTIFWLEDVRSQGKPEVEKMFQFESEYESLTNLIKPILVAQITAAFSTPEKFFKDALYLLITDQKGEGLFDPIENTALKEMLKTLNETHSGKVLFSLFHKLDKKNHDLTLNAFIELYGEAVALYSIYPLEKNLK